ncbi:MAG TPA: DUF1080 domain-containing protein [Candidatus Kryptonia bacterium]|nr:DUF1080 domain-containing protein [Candidatus Kryptonia bacterium]
MPRWSAIAAAALFTALAAVTSSHPAAAQSKDGWITLFDGKSLDNFTPLGDANWRIEDGVLVADKASKISNLVSKQDYTDFQIRAEFWVSEDANSGIYIRCTDPNAVSSKTAYEVNIFDTRPDPSYGTGAIVGVAKVTTPIKAGGKWNVFEITAKGPRFDVILNGVKTVDGGTDAKFAKGRIALQYGQGVVKFRKVEIKPL